MSQHMSQHPAQHMAQHGKIVQGVAGWLTSFSARPHPPVCEGPPPPRCWCCSYRACSRHIHQCSISISPISWHKPAILPYCHIPRGSGQRTQIGQAEWLSAPPPCPSISSPPPPLNRRNNELQNIALDCLPPSGHPVARSAGVCLIASSSQVFYWTNGTV